MEQAQQVRDKNRAALAAAYESSLKQIETRIQKSVTKLNSLRYVLAIPIPYASNSLTSHTHTSPFPTPVRIPFPISHQAGLRGRNVERSNLTQIASSAQQITHLKKLQFALDRRDAKTSQIARALAEHRRRMLNLGVQLQALYAGRKEDVAALMRGGLEEAQGAGGKSMATGDGIGGNGRGQGRMSSGRVDGAGEGVMSGKGK